MKPTVYIETSVISYLTARPSRDVIAVANQELTRSWWRLDRVGFHLFSSRFVLEEAAQGDPEAAARRLDALKDIPVLEETVESVELSITLLRGMALPAKAQVDAMHIAMAAVHGMDYLLTWNCQHINNAAKRCAIQAVCQSAEYGVPVICTPCELTGGTDNE